MAPIEVIPAPLLVLIIVGLTVFLISALMSILYGNYQDLIVNIILFIFMSVSLFLASNIFGEIKEQENLVEMEKNAIAEEYKDDGLYEIEKTHNTLFKKESDYDYLIKLKDKKNKYVDVKCDGEDCKVYEGD